MDENEISKQIIGAALRDHKALGPGILESVYEIVLARELTKQGLPLFASNLFPFFTRI